MNAIGRVKKFADDRALSTETQFCTLVKSDAFLDALNKAGMIGDYDSPVYQGVVEKLWTKVLEALMVPGICFVVEFCNGSIQEYEPLGQQHKSEVDFTSKVRRLMSIDVTLVVTPESRFAPTSSGGLCHIYPG